MESIFLRLLLRAQQATTAAESHSVIEDAFHEYIKDNLNHHEYSRIYFTALHKCSAY